MEGRKEGRKEDGRAAPENKIFCWIGLPSSSSSSLCAKPKEAAGRRTLSLFEVVDISFEMPTTTENKNKNKKSIVVVGWARRTGGGGWCALMTSRFQKNTMRIICCNKQHKKSMPCNCNLLPSINIIMALLLFVHRRRNA
jgi:hypothetical protein